MPRVLIIESVRFMIDCFEAVGVSSKPARQQACMLINADIIGHISHGMNRLENYIKDIKAGNCQPNNQPKILKETVSTAWVDAKNVLGATAGHFAMNIAINKAHENGVGWVSVKSSNHCGMVGYWTSIAADHGLIGIAYSNSSPLVCPTRSKKSCLGTNPIAIAAAGCDGEIFYLDMSTSSVSLGKIEIAMRKNEPIPLGWAQDETGELTTDAKKAYAASCLTPLGGSENTSGFKGYGLAAMVELLCGVSSGSNYGHHIRKWSDFKHGSANLGHCFVAVDPTCFAPGFGERLTDLMKYWRQLEPADPNKPVLAIGDKEKQNREKNTKNGFINYLDQQIQSTCDLAKILNVKPPQIMKK